MDGPTHGRRSSGHMHSYRPKWERECRSAVEYVNRSIYGEGRDRGHDRQSGGGVEGGGGVAQSAPCGNI